MGISKRVREIERGIDAGIRDLPTWQGSRAEVLGDLVRTYRDAVELVFAKLLHAETFDRSPEEIGTLCGHENRLRAGALWALKWASEYCPEIGTPTSRDPKELVDLLFLGGIYETFVDALKSAQHGVVKIAVDEASRTMSFYEGGPATAFDRCIIHRERIAGPMTRHVSLTEDSDQLTSRWTAGDYRRVTMALATDGAHKEKIICVDPEFLAQIGKTTISISQPTIIWLDRPSETPDCDVFDDLVLPRVLDGGLKWKLVALLDTPIIQVGNRFCALSSDLKTIAVIGDYMLRLAARIDPNQYSVATTHREGRMINKCRDVLEQSVPPWSVVARVHYKDPPQEGDVVASRGMQKVVIQLKSTLRPETPWEVCKRNEAIIDGVKHTKGLINRGAGTQGFVVTDGYRGDYACWAAALASGIPIATLDDLDVIAMDPVEAVAEIKSRVGITTSVPDPPEGLADREAELMGWTLRFLDECLSPEPA